MGRGSGIDLETGPFPNRSAGSIGATIQKLPPQLFIGERPDPGKLRPLRVTEGSSLSKPAGGLWTSSLQDDGTSQWTHYAESIGHGAENASVWQLLPRACRVLKISSLEDHDAVLARYPYKGKLRDVLPAETFPLIDWTAIARDCDAVWLTNGRLDLPIASPFHGWDVESTIWFSWEFSSVQPVTPAG